MGLGKIFFYSVIGGVSLAVSLSAQQHTIGYGFVFENIFSQIAPEMGDLITILSAILSIYSVYRISKFFRIIIQNKLPGISVSVLCYGGSFFVVWSSGNFQVLLVGVMLWALSFVIVVSFRNRLAEYGK